MKISLQICVNWDGQVAWAAQVDLQDQRIWVPPTGQPFWADGSNRLVTATEINELKLQEVMDTVMDLNSKSKRTESQSLGPCE